MTSVIDLTRFSVDRFTSLPPEVLEQIISYLFPSHNPNKAWEDIRKPWRDVSLGHRDMVSIALTCRALQSHVYHFCGHLLEQHRSITYAVLPKTALARAKANHLLVMRQWAATRCVFCGRKSMRRAIFMNGLNCCASCDREQWPDKLTLTAAREEFNLLREHLLPEDSPEDGKPWLPGPRYGTYILSTQVTTMFERHHVRKQAERVHGDLDLYLRKREERRAKMRKKWDDRSSADLRAGANNQSTAST